MNPSDFRLKQIQNLLEEGEIDFSILELQIFPTQIQSFLKSEPGIEYCSRFRADTSQLTSFSFTCLKVGDTFAYLDQELDFNRYRAILLNSEFYKDWSAFKVSEFKVYARKYEGECAKIGHKNGIWNSDKSELIFGASARPGDLGYLSGGSSGWKLLALKNLLIDLYFFTKKTPFIRISIYDKIMFEGKLFSFSDLLKNGNNEPIIKFLSRRFSAVHA